MKGCSILAVIVMLFSILACVFMLCESKSLAMQLADQHASIRLLIEFHLKFNSEAGVSADQYHKAVEAFASGNPDFRGLWFYNYYLGQAEQKNSTEPPAKEPKISD